LTKDIGAPPPVRNDLGERPLQGRQVALTDLIEGDQVGDLCVDHRSCLRRRPAGIAGSDAAVAQGFSCSTRTGATGTPSAGVGAADGSPIAFGSAAFEGVAVAGTPSAGVGAPDRSPIAFGWAVFEEVAAVVHPARTPTRQPTTAAHNA